MPAKQPSPEPARTDAGHDAGGQLVTDRIQVSSPAGLLAAVPFLVGFEPSEPSIVIIGTREEQVAVTLRYDAPAPALAGSIARHAAEILSANNITAACAAGYGPGELITPVADALRPLLADAGITLTELLRAQDGRYWSYLCAEPGCCPAEGTPFDPGSCPLTLAGAVSGQVLKSRDALAATVAPVTGQAARSMRSATTAAEKRLGQLASQDGVIRQRALAGPGLEAVAAALELYRGGGHLESHQDAAWLTLVLRNLRVRDDAWARMDPALRGPHLRLWRDLTTLARPGYAAAPASLLAFTAWQDGNGALANLALDRALADNPRYSMALLLRQTLNAGAPPSMARLPMTPEEVASAYDAAEQQPRSRDNARRKTRARTRAASGRDQADQPGAPGTEIPAPATAEATPAANG